MKLSGIKRAISSERIASKVLEELGFRIVDTNRKLYINNVEVGEVDIVAEDSEGVKYAVEVKAGKIDITGIRQAYVNALIAGMKPLVVCKGYADESARQLAEKLGVKVIQLSDIFLVEDEELEIVVKEAVEEAVCSYMELLFMSIPGMTSEYYEILSTIAESPSFNEAAEKLGLDPNTFARKINELKSAGIIPRWAKKYSSIRRVARLLVEKHDMVQTLHSINQMLDKIKDTVSHAHQLTLSLKQCISVVDKLVKRLTILSSTLEKKASSILKIEEAKEKPLEESEQESKKVKREG